MTGIIGSPISHRADRPLGLARHATPMRLARGERDWRAVRGLVPALLILPFAEDVTFHPLGADDVRLAPPFLWLVCLLEEPLSGPAVILFVDADEHGLAVEILPADAPGDELPDDAFAESFRPRGTSFAQFGS